MAINIESNISRNDKVMLATPAHPISRYIVIAVVLSVRSSSSASVQTDLSERKEFKIRRKAFSSCSQLDLQFSVGFAVRYASAPPVIPLEVQVVHGPN